MKNALLAQRSSNLSIIFIETCLVQISSQRPCPWKVCQNVSSSSDGNYFPYFCIWVKSKGSTDGNCLFYIGIQFELLGDKFEHTIFFYTVLNDKTFSMIHRLRHGLAVWLESNLFYLVMHCVIGVMVNNSTSGLAISPQ